MLLKKKKSQASCQPNLKVSLTKSLRREVVVCYYYLFIYLFFLCRAEGDYTVTKNMTIQDNCSESLTCRNRAPVTLNITPVSLKMLRLQPFQLSRIGRETHEFRTHLTSRNLTSKFSRFVTMNSNPNQSRPRKINSI